LEQKNILQFQGKKTLTHHVNWQNQKSILAQNLTMSDKKSALSAETLQRKSVRFSDITIREYPMILGDNPSVSHGPPVTIDWQHSSEAHLSLDQYSETRPLTPLTRLEMVIPSFLREDIVINSGCQYSEIIDTMYEVDLIKTQRIVAVKSSVRHSKLIGIGRSIKRTVLQRRRSLS